MLTECPKNKYKYCFCCLALINTLQYFLQIDLSLESKGEDDNLRDPESPVEKSSIKAETKCTTNGLHMSSQIQEDPVKDLNRKPPIPVQRGTSFLKQMRRLSAPSLSKEVRASVKWKVDSEHSHIRERELDKWKNNHPFQNVAITPPSSEITEYSSSSTLGAKVENTQDVEEISRNYMNVEEVSKGISKKYLHDTQNLLPENVQDNSVIIDHSDSLNTKEKVIQKCDPVSPVCPMPGWRSSEDLCISSRKIGRTLSMPGRLKKCSWIKLKSNDSGSASKVDGAEREIAKHTDQQKPHEDLRNDKDEVVIECSSSVSAKHSDVQQWDYSISREKRASVKWQSERGQGATNTKVNHVLLHNPDNISGLGETQECSQEIAPNTSERQCIDTILCQTQISTYISAKEHGDSAEAIVTNIANTKDRNKVVNYNYTDTCGQTYADSVSSDHIRQISRDKANLQNSSGKVLRRWTLPLSESEKMILPQDTSQETKPEFKIMVGIIGLDNRKCSSTRGHRVRFEENVIMESVGEKTVSTHEQGVVKRCNNKTTPKKKINFARCSWTVLPSELNNGAIEENERPAYLGDGTLDSSLQNAQEVGDLCNLK